MESLGTGIDLGPDTDQVFLVLFGMGWRFRSSLAGMGNVPLELTVDGRIANPASLNIE